MNSRNRQVDYAMPVLVTRHNDAHEKKTCQILELNPSGLMIDTQMNLVPGEIVTVHLLRNPIDFTVSSSEVSTDTDRQRVQLTKVDREQNLDHFFSCFTKKAG